MSSQPDPRPYVGHDVRHNGDVARIVAFECEEDEGDLRVYLITEDDTCWTLAWGIDYSRQFTIVR